MTGQVTGTTASVTGTSSGHGTGVERLPDHTLVAVGATDVGPSLVRTWNQAATQLKASGQGGELDSLSTGLSQFGLKLPGDLATVFGQQFDVAYGGTAADGLPEIGVRSSTSPAKVDPVIAKLNALLRQVGPGFQIAHHAASGGGYAAALSPSYAAQLGAGGHLGSSAAFRAAVPDAAGAGTVVYVDVAGLAAAGDLGDSASDRADAQAISAIGFSASATSATSGSFELRVITH